MHTNLTDTYDASAHDAHEASAVTTFNPRGIYCRATGRLMGVMTEEMWESIPLSIRSDAMRIREATLAATRMGPGWIIKRRDSYTALRESDPVGLTVYLCGVVFDAMENTHKSTSFKAEEAQQTYMPRWESVQAHNQFIARKIELFQHLAELPEMTISLALDSLLELDARRGLHTIAPPVGLSFQHFLTDFKASLARLLTHCDAEIEEARLNGARSGTYYARHAVGLQLSRIPDGNASPQLSAATLRQRRKDREAQESRMIFINALLEAGIEMDTRKKGDTTLRPPPRPSSYDYGTKMLKQMERAERLKHSIHQGGVKGGRIKL